MIGMRMYRRNDLADGFLSIVKGFVVILFVIFFGLWDQSKSLWAQVGERSAPSSTYYMVFREFYAGDYKNALNGFQSEARGCIKAGTSRWIDSICYETMIGECYYQTGILDEALKHYNLALELVVAFPDWMTQVQFPQIRSAGPHKPYPWGVSKRQSMLGSYPSSMLIGQGQTVTAQVNQKLSVLQQAVLYPIRPQEIIRCTALAIRRRAELLGPICKNDPVTERATAALSRQITKPNNWSEAWADLERGLALIAAGKDSQGTTLLQRSLLVAGEFDHPLTCVALLELGRSALMRSDYPAALQFFEEASYSAADYSDYGVLEEALRHAALTHLVTNRKAFYTPLQGVLQWSKVKDLRQLRASLALSAAENNSVLEQIKEAVAMLDEARLVLGQRRAVVGRLGARFSYLSAQVLFQQRKNQEAQMSLASAMDYMKHGSRRLFQIALADELYTSGAAPSRTAMDYYNELLRDPSPGDWTLDPMETLAVLLAPHPLSLEHWFEAALDRRDQETAWEIADRARRHRFFTSLEMGGRLESLRWILEAPAESLDQQSLLQRQDLLSRWPQYARLSEQASSIRAKLANAPLVIDDQARRKEQSKELGELSSLGGQQEAILREIALRREPAAMIFPPQRSIAEVKKSLPKGHAILAFFFANRRLYSLLMSNSDYSYWELGSPPALTKQVKDFLHDLGQYQQNHELTLKELTDAKWNQSAVKTLEALLKGSRADFSKPFDELTIVPDGILWFLPFDALQVTADGKLKTLISRFRIRYAPTLSLATSTRTRTMKPAGNTAVVLGKLFPRDDESASKTAFDRLAAALPGAVALKSPQPGPMAAYKTLFGRLIVLDDLAVNEQEPYGWVPAPMDRGGKSGGTLADWMALPWGGPEQIVLPGFHTAAEDAMKKPSRGAPGDEVFLSVCGLMSCGARTILLSRWRTGGQSSFDLVREFAQELPHTSPTDAWQRAVMLQSAAQLNLQAEPRVKRTQSDETLDAGHPFFWAGYMLLDTGQVSQKSEPKPPAPADKPKKSDAQEVESAEPQKKQEKAKTQ
jgi:CHAT domain-containing protein